MSLPKLNPLYKTEDLYITSFGGINRSEGSLNEFEDIIAMRGNTDGSLETIKPWRRLAGTYSPIGKIPLAFLPIEQNSVFNVYTVCEDGMYKNATFLPLVYYYCQPNAPSQMQLGLKNFSVSYINNAYTLTYRANATYGKMLCCDNIIFSAPHMLSYNGNICCFLNRELLLITNSIYSATASTVFPINGLTELINLYSMGEELNIEVDGTLLIPPQGSSFRLIATGNNKAYVASVDSYNNQSSIAFTWGTGWHVIKLCSASIPRLSAVTTAYNRLWGVSGNKIYCSMLNKPLIFNYFAQSPSDSWWADTGAGEAFTAITSYNGRVVAFKPQAAYEAYGGVAPFSLREITGAFGCVDARSVAEAANIMLLLTKDGIFSYGGGNFRPTGEPLGDAPLNAAAGGMGPKYYVSFGGKLYVYDYYRGNWFCDGEEDFTCFYVYSGALLAIDKNGTVSQIDGSDITGVQYIESNQLFWSFTTNRIGERQFSKKSIINGELRLVTKSQAAITIYIDCDDTGFVKVYEHNLTAGRAYYNIPLKFRLCNSFRIKAEGNGNVALLGINIRLRNAGRATNL